MATSSSSVIRLVYRRGSLWVRTMRAIDWPDPYVRSGAAGGQSRVRAEGGKVMSASSLVLDSARPERRPAFLLLVGIVFVLVALASHSVNAYPTSCNSVNVGC